MSLKWFMQIMVMQRRGRLYLIREDQDRLWEGAIWAKLGMASGAGGRHQPGVGRSWTQREVGNWERSLGGRTGQQGNVSQRPLAGDWKLLKILFIMFVKMMWTEHLLIVSNLLTDFSVINCLTWVYIMIILLPFKSKLCYKARELNTFYFLFMSDKLKCL